MLLYQLQMVVSYERDVMRLQAKRLVFPLQECS